VVAVSLAPKNQAPVNACRSLILFNLYDAVRRWKAVETAVNRCKPVDEKRPKILTRFIGFVRLSADCWLLISSRPAKRDWFLSGAKQIAPARS
jgi:hypothetical protein